MADGAGTSGSKNEDGVEISPEILAEKIDPNCGYTPEETKQLSDTDKAMLKSFAHNVQAIKITVAEENEVTTMIEKVRVAETNCKEFREKHGSKHSNEIAPSSNEEDVAGKVNSMLAANRLGAKKDHTNVVVDRLVQRNVKDLTKEELNALTNNVSLVEVESASMMIYEYDKGNEVPLATQEAIAERGRDAVIAECMWLKDALEEVKNHTDSKLRQENCQASEEEHEPDLSSDDVIIESAAKKFPNAYTKDFSLRPRISNRPLKANKRYKG